MNLLSLQNQTLESVASQSVAGAPAIASNAVSVDASGENAELRAAAQDFEAMMLEHMLKSMRDANEALTEDGVLNSREQKFWREFQDSQLAMELARVQGLGLADAIVRQVEHMQGDVP